MAVNRVELNIVKSIKKIFKGAITARQDSSMKMMTETGGSSIISVVKSTIFSVDYVEEQYYNIDIENEMFSFEECE